MQTVKSAYSPDNLAYDPDILAYDPDKLVYDSDNLAAGRQAVSEGIMWKGSRHDQLHCNDWR